MAAMQITLDPATLSNIADGNLEDQFQQGLAEIMKEVFNDLKRWERTGNYVIAKINMETIFMCDVTSGNVSVAVRATTVRPKRVLISRSLYKRNGQWLVGEDPTQDPLPLRPPVRVVESPEK